jgi:hypothetical protein
MQRWQSQEVNIMMDPITNYQFGKARHQELEAESARYGNRQASMAGAPGQPAKHQPRLRPGSVIFAMLTSVTRLISQAS